MMRSPGASGEVGNPVIGPVLLKNCRAVGCRSKVSCPGSARARLRARGYPGRSARQCHRRQNTGQDAHLHVH